MTQPNLTRGDELTSAQDELLRDFAEHGLRMDLNPTHILGDEDTEAFWHAYFRQADEHVRNRARDALKDRAPAVQPDRAAAGVTDAMVEKALRAIVPGGAQVFHWLPTSDNLGLVIHDTARTVMRAALTAILLDVAGERESVLRVKLRGLADVWIEQAKGTYQPQNIRNLLKECAAYLDELLARTSGADGEGK